MNKEDTASRFANTPAALTAKNHCKPINRNKKRLNKQKMLYPIAVLGMLGIKPGKVNSGGYWILRCPFHKNGQEKKPSLHLHQVNGNFICHACGERGDILKFYIKAADVPFNNAMKALCVSWEVE
jgi:hypothetical protein